MTSSPYVQLVSYKRWADRGLHDVIDRNADRLPPDDAANLIRILDHIHVVDRIFRHHLQGSSHAFIAPRSAELPDLAQLIAETQEVDAWYVSFAEGAAAGDFDRRLEFAFTSGAPARMTAGEILLHVGLHGAYHRGNAGILLMKNGIAPNDDRLTDFLEQPS